VATAADGIATPQPVLLVEDLTRHRVLYRHEVTAGSLLLLSYVHSSEHVPVRGTFVLGADGTLLVKETAFAGFGPGLPEPKAGEAWRREGGMIVAAGGGQRLDELRIRVAPFTRHRLRAPSGEDLDLSALMPDGGSVRVSVNAPRPARAAPPDHRP
jgi:hypothetical protein